MSYTRKLPQSHVVKGVDTRVTHQWHKGIAGWRENARWILNTLKNGLTRVCKWVDIDAASGSRGEKGDEGLGWIVSLSERSLNIRFTDVTLWIFCWIGMNKSFCVLKAKGEEEVVAVSLWVAQFSSILHYLKSVTPFSIQTVSHTEKWTLTQACAISSTETLYSSR